MPVKIRPATPADAPGLMRLNIDFNGPGTQTTEGMAVALSAPSPELVLVAQQEGTSELLGFCCCLLKNSLCYGEPSGEVTEFYVDPRYRRQGIGRALLMEAINQCQARGAQEITLLTGDDNLPAQALYTAGGFTPSGELHMEWEG